MDKAYKVLEREIKEINRKKEYDLFQKHLEIEMAIDRFYIKPSVSINEMAVRYIKLDVGLRKVDILLVPALIAVIFGLLVNMLFNLFTQGPLKHFNIIEPLMTLIDAINSSNWAPIIFAIILLLSLLFMLVFFSTLMCAVPIPFIVVLIDLLNIDTYQVKYEMKILQKKLQQNMDQYKDSEEFIYKSDHHDFLIKLFWQKHRNKIVCCVIAIAVIYMIFNYTNRIVMIVMFTLGFLFKRSYRDSNAGGGKMTNKKKEKDQLDNE